MKIRFLGTGVGIPQAGRVQSGLIMEMIGKPVLFDCGCGVLGRIAEAGYTHTDIENIVLTHLHLDHVGDVLALLKANWLKGKTKMRIFGPQGTQEWFGKVIDTYDYLQGRFEVEITELAGGETFTPKGTDCNISCIPTVHSTPSLAYRVECGKKIVVYTGDTEPSKPVFEFSREADVMIHECSFPLGFETDNHTTPDMFTDVLKQTPLYVKILYFIHLYPHMQGHEQEAMDHVSQYFSNEVRIASDLLEIVV
ncbi:MBL fold metallo-hydrolase [Methanolobus halotolerans]|uniref:Arylsulfatase n=1 Tax=Methanolobus halotolerans TaxID=2052935 RepID=A0A4E0QRR9_9EURY|nr:MBL fold metallo-hydrolase [Methanolobus halotolerans]TGC09371.1 arylsulfatase [Methanolobus halotolerans]